MWIRKASKEPPQDGQQDHLIMEGRLAVTKHKFVFPLFQNTSRIPNLEDVKAEVP